MKLSKTIMLTIILVLLIINITDCKKKRRRPNNLNKRPPPRIHKKKPSLFGGLFKKQRRPGSRDHRGDESKRVYYYSMPTQKPRIILGDELNFSELGILNKQKQQSSNKIPQPLILSSQQQSSPQFINDYDYDVIPQRNEPPLRNHHPHKQNNPPPRQGKKSPGYRIPDNSNWENHYVLSHENNNNKKKRRGPPKVMDSMMRAASELRNAYKGIIIGSAKVAKYTGSAASNYIKGVRNIFGGNLNNNRKVDSPPQVLRIPDGKLRSEGVEATAPAKLVELDYEEPTSSGGGSTIPVHLDWGSSFWKLFYNKSKSSLSEIEKKVDEKVDEGVVVVS